MVTIHIEDSCIRMLEVKGRRVEKAASLPLEAGLVRDGVVVDTEAVGLRIKELMEAHGVLEKQVIASISGIHSIYRVVRLPRLPKGMLGEAASREMDRVMSVPLNELYTSWQAVEVSGVETVMCLVGLPRNTVDAMLETLRQAGLQSQVMDIRPLALARVADEKDAIIINVQPSGFDIVLMINGIPELLRSLPFPSGDIAESEKVTMIKDELDRTVAFYNSSHKANPVTGTMAAFVSGELREVLTETLGYSVKPLPEWLSYPEGFDASEYVVNIGLALKQVKGSVSRLRVNINVVPEAYLPKRVPIIAFVSWAFVLVAIAVLVPLAVLTQREVSETLALRSQVDDARLKVEVRQGTREVLEGLQARLEEARDTQAVFQEPLDTFEAQRARLNSHLSKVTSLLPGTVDLASIWYSDESEIRVKKTVSLFANKKITIYVRVRVEGTAPDEATILSYSRSLRDTGRFSGVVISDMFEVEYNKWAFILALDVAETELVKKED